ncbi:hypothetical protein ACFLS9_08810 [Bacteroidota bacterium]
MKNTILILLLLFSTALFAQDSKYSNSVCSVEQAEANYIAGLISDNLGLKMSSAYFLGEMKSLNSVVKLMEMLRSSKNVNERLIAALSLTKIGDSRGIFLLKQKAELCECARTKSMCAKFYNAYIKEKYKTSRNLALEGDKNFIELACSLDHSFQ